MKAVILAGGYGTRLSEETELRPKPMVEIGGKPILWHIMKMYTAHGITDFVICCGYKAFMIKEYFANYALHNSDFTFDFRTNKLDVHHDHSEPWSVTVVDTGEGTMTGGRLKRVARYLTPGEDFCFTYGDGVGDVDITAAIRQHQDADVLATLTATQPTGRFGALSIEGAHVAGFEEKPQGDGGWVNGGFFVLSPGVLDLIEGDDTVWERGPLESLAGGGQLGAFFHRGFWQPMDTLTDRRRLEGLWESGSPPWRMW
jgi:glucose-1-phosphate cytidylyltransferase